MTERSVSRRRLIGWSGLAVAAAPLVGAGTADAAGGDRIPPDARPGGAYDRYVARLAAEGKFSGVVLLSHRGRTVLSRSYGLADRARRIPHHESTAFNLSSAGKPFSAVAILQLAQRGRLRLSDPVGTYVTGLARDVAERVTLHHLLSGASGLEAPPEDVERVFHSREEVHEFFVGRARQAKPAGIPGVASAAHQEADVTLPALVIEAVTGQTYWDYTEENIFRRAGMTGSGFRTRPRWLTDRRLAHPYMRVAGGGEVDALHHLDQGSPDEWVLGKNPGRAFVDAPGDGGFATAPDLVRFATALGDGTLLDRPWADVFTAPRTPLGAASFAAYAMPVAVVGGQWVYQRAGGNPGVGANWSIYPDTGWTGVILGNRDDLPLVEMINQEVRAITGVLPEDEGSGG